MQGKTDGFGDSGNEKCACVHIRLQTALPFFRRPLNPVHGIKQLFVLHADVQRKRFSRLCENVQHFLPRFRAFGCVCQNNHGEIVVHQLLADIQDIDLVFGQKFRNIVNDADAVFTDPQPSLG